MKTVKISSLINLLLFSSISICGASAAIAGGVGLGTTRVIYPQNSSQASLSIQNTDASKVFLIQSWVSNPDGNKSADFIITPPIFVIQPKKKIRCVLCLWGKNHCQQIVSLFIT